MEKKFQRRIESFTCQACNRKVEGNGYTNHCPLCLYSLHCDVNPGDRAEDCGGLMEPIAATLQSGVHMVIHRCKKCGLERVNKISPGDDRSALFKLPLVDFNQFRKRTRGAT